MKEYEKAYENIINMIISLNNIKNRNSRVNSFIKLGKELKKEISIYKKNIDDILTLNKLSIINDIIYDIMEIKALNFRQKDLYLMQIVNLVMVKLNAIFLE